MVVTSASKIDWRPAVVRRARPVRARGFMRAALVIAAVALSIEALPGLAGKEAGASIAAALPPGLGQLQVYAGSGHGAWRDEPEAAFAALRRFILA